MVDDTHDKGSAVVCARCGAYGRHVCCHAGQVGDRERILWFCARCLDPHHDTPGLSGG